MRNKAFNNLIIALCVLLVLAMMAGLTACSESKGSSNADPNKQNASASGANSQGNTSDNSGGIESVLEFNNGPSVTITANDETYELKKDIKTYLFIGIDSALPNDAPLGGEWKGSQCDVLALYVIDEAKKEYGILNINRDAVVSVDVLDFDGNIVAEQDQQIEFAFSYTMDRTKNSENAVRAVSRLIGGIPIDGYVTIAYGALPALNDEIGGVTVTIPEDLSKVDPAFTKGAEIRLNGAQAERFIRVREGLDDESNQQRMRRQQIYLTEFKKTVRQRLNDNSGIINEMYKAALPYMTSDMSSGQITNIVASCVNYEQAKNLSLFGTESEVTYSTGQTHTEFEINRNSLDNAVLELFYSKE